MMFPLIQNLSETNNCLHAVNLMFYKIFYFHFDFPACRKAQTDSTDGTKNRKDGLEGGVYI